MEPARFTVFRISSVERGWAAIAQELSLVITCISDTHELHRDVRVPDGDILIFAGDITFFSQRAAVLSDFNEWLGEQPHRHKIVIPGNHDTLLLDPAQQKLITNAHLLIDSGVELAGLKIWGSPATPYADTAFGIPTPEARKEHWSKIPKDIDVLVTHGPPIGILDCAPGSDSHQGDPELLKAIAKGAPNLHVFGHVHGAYGTYELYGTLFANCALAGPHGDLDKPPMQIKLEPMAEN